MAERAHGYARYRLDNCRCYVCGFAVSQYERNRAKAKAVGTWQPYVDAAPVREHLALLSAAGIGYKRAAMLAGVSKSVVRNVLHVRTGRTQLSRRIRPHIAEAILAIRPEAVIVDAADHAVIDATGTRRRIAALAAIGWSLSQQAQRIGWTTQNFAPLLSTEHVIAATARLVVGLYELLSMTPAPAGYSATRTRRWAAARGYLPPLAWDDDTIDQPDGRPELGVLVDGEDADEGLIWLALNGFLEAAELPDAERVVVRRHRTAAVP